jgi:hypothetical protein
MNALLVFIAFVALDLVWARYINAVSDGHRWRAGLWSGITIALGGFGAVQYVNDPWLLLPAILGGVIGTLLGTKTK